MFKLVCRNWFAEVKTLDLFTADFSKGVQLLAGFNAFGDGLNANCFSQQHNCLNDLFIFGAGDN